MDSSNISINVSDKSKASTISVNAKLVKEALKEGELSYRNLLIRLKIQFTFRMKTMNLLM